jgi:hypothetical protein
MLLEAELYNPDTLLGLSDHRKPCYNACLLSLLAAQQCDKGRDLFENVMQTELEPCKVCQGLTRGKDLECQCMLITKEEELNPNLINWALVLISG